MDMLGPLLSIGFVFALLGAAIWLLRRNGLAGRASRGRGHFLELVESRPLSPGHTLHLVRIAGRGVVVATCGSGCALIESRPWRELAGATEDSI
ncbi:MAG: FliO/MopB family protein [Bryobacterales bacterium]|nr:FliO/MopB family protein [Bryobacterales bacterium]